MAQACNPSNSEKLKFVASLDKKFGRPHLNQWLDVIVYSCHPSYTGKHKQETQGTGWPGHKAKVYFKNNQHKKG
jgi:ribosomal protein L31